MKTIRVLIIIVIFSVFTPNVHAQADEDYEVIRDTYVRLYGGLNFSRIQHDSLELKTVLYPQFGLDVAFRLSDDFDLMIAGEYAVIGGQIKTPLYKIRNQYARGMAMARYRITDDVAASVGGAYAYLVKSEAKTLSGTSASGVEFTPLDGYENQLEVTFGLELPITKKTDLVGMLYLPVNTDVSYYSVAFTLRYHMNY